MTQGDDVRGAAEAERRPTVSVVMPVRDAASYLRRCLDSLTVQSFAEWEAVCVDDGSADGSGRILDEYAAADPRFRVVHQENAGRVAARRRGLELAVGDYVAYCDADDVLCADYLVRLYGAAEATGADIVVASMTRTSPGGREERWTAVAGSVDGYVERYAGTFGFNSLCNKLYRRSLCAAPGMTVDERIFMGEDLLLNFRLLSRCASIGFAEDAVYGYRLNPAGTMADGRYGREAVRQMLDVVAEIFVSADGRWPSATLFLRHYCLVLMLCSGAFDAAEFASAFRECQTVASLVSDRRLRWSRKALIAFAWLDYGLAVRLVRLLVRLRGR